MPPWLSVLMDGLAALLAAIFPWVEAVFICVLSSQYFLKLWCRACACLTIGFLSLRENGSYSFLLF